jgi:ribosomal protein S18 acetylase RimI-like enzyme
MVGYDSHRAWVYYVAVSPSVRGTGLGRSLMVACEEWAVARGAPKLMLMVRRTNAAVVGFYERLGYALEDTAVMGRRLDGA